MKKKSIALLVAIAVIVSNGTFYANAEDFSSEAADNVFADQQTDEMTYDEADASIDFEDEEDEVSDDIEIEDTEDGETDTAPDEEQDEIFFSDDENETEVSGSEKKENASEEEMSNQDVANFAVTSGSCGKNLKWSFDDGVLTISGKGEMYDFSQTEGELFAPWDPYKTHYVITKVVVEKGVTSIGAFAFCDCYDLESVILPSGLISIGNNAFLSAGVKNIILPSSIRVIDYCAFEHCHFLKSITLPDGLTYIGESAFAGCKFESIRLPSDLVTVNDGMFQNCSELKEVYIGNKVNTIGKLAFYECFKLEKVVFSSDVTSIGNAAFKGCNLKNIKLPWSLTSIGYKAFYECTLKSIVLPSGLISIEDSAFENCKQLESVVWRSGSTTSKSIGKSVFARCSSLKSVILPLGLTSTGEETFRSCSSLESIVIPTSVTSIDYATFYECDALRKITLPTDITSIGASAFAACYHLENIVLPPEITEIGQSAFSHCRSLKSITLPSSLVSVNWHVFAYCSSLTEVNIKNGVTCIKESTFYQSPVVKISIPVSIKELDSSIFNKKLQDLYYKGTEKQWKELYKNNTWLEKAVQNMEKNGGVIHYNDDGMKDEAESAVCFFTEWDAQKQIAYWAGLDLYGSQVTARTDMSFLENLDNLVGKYVLVTKRDRRQGAEGPSELLSIKAVETRSGIISTADENTVTINGNTYKVAEKLELPDSYVNEFVLYHILNDNSVYVQKLERAQGTLNYWNAKTGQMKIDKVNYELGSCAEGSCKKFLGDTGYTSVYVEYWSDWSQHIYKITDKIDPTTSKVPNFYETYVPPTKEEEILWQNVQEWDRAYETYIEAVRNALRSFSGTEGEKKETTVSAEAKRMQKADQSSNSKYLTGNLGRYSDYAYKALAEYLYEYTCDNMKFSSLKDTDVVNSVIKALSGANKTYQYGDDIEITVNMTLLNKSGTGHLEIKEKGRQVQLVIINTPQKEVEISVGKYLDALQDLAVDSMVNVATAVSKDILGESLSSLTEKYISKTVDNIEKKLAVKLSEKFNLAGVGNLVQGMNKCYSFYSYVNANMGHWDNIEGILGNVEKLQFKDTSIKDKAVKKAMSALEKEKTQFVRAFQKYMAGTLGEEEGFFKLFFKCPVDIEVYNSSGEKIGCASETELWYDSSIEIVSQGGAKIVTVLTEDLPSVKVFSRAYGTMDYTIEELNTDHKPIGRLNYYDISLTPGQEYSMDVNKNLEQNKDTMAIKTNGQNILADEFISVKESAGVLISCKAEADDENEGGSIRGSGTYIRGNAVVLSAIPDEGYSFDGWYQGDSLVSLNRTYEFTARNNTVFTAKFVRVMKKEQSCNHVWGKGKVTKQPTVAKAGEQVFTCTICGKKLTKIYGEKLKATIKLNVTSLVLQKKQSTKSVKVTMANGDAVKSWKSSNKKIVTVDNKGIIRAQNKTGNAKITVILKSGKSATIKIKVQKAKVKTTKLGNLKSKISLKKGKTITLKPNVIPLTSQEKVTYKSSNKNIATVSAKGVIKGKKKGTAKITVQSGKKKYVINVKIQ